MYKNFILLFLGFLFVSTSAWSQSTNDSTIDSSKSKLIDSTALYGLIPERPVKVGGGPVDQRKYLGSLRDEQKDISGGFSGPLFYIGLFGFSLYFCKDCINGRSIAKRIIKLQVVDNKTNQVASPLQCFIRNIFCIIWPVEVVVTLINPNRRIGDQVAGTKVVYYNPASVEQPRIEIGKTLVPILLSFGILLLITLPFKSLQSSMQRVKYVESSYNDTESKKLEKLFSDSLGQNLSASVKVYDKIENQNLKYVSVIYRLKENYLDNPHSSRELKKITMQYLYSIIPENTFTGKAQYVYQESGRIQTSSNQIGTPISQTTK